MLKRFVKKLVSYLLVGTLMMQDGIPVAAANNIDDLYPGDFIEYGENMLPKDVFKKDEETFAYWNTTDFAMNITSVAPTSGGKGITIQFGSESLGGDYLSSIYLTKSDFKLENGHTYQISYKVKSTKERAFQSGFDGTGDRDAHKYELKADTEEEISYTITTNGEWNKLMFYMGIINDMPADIGEHSITISDLSIQEIINERITEISPELLDTPNDEPYATITDLKNHKGYEPSSMNLIKDGKFLQKLKKWDFYEVDWMETWDVVQCQKVENGIAFKIGNVGGEENNPYDIQLSQKISLAKNVKYVLSFKVHSEKARSIKIVIPDIDGGKSWEKPIAIQKDETREVVLNLPKVPENVVKDFHIQMGYVGTSVENNTVTLTDVKLEVSGYSELAERISDGYFDDGEQGNFTVRDSGNATVSFDESYINAKVNSVCDDNDVVVSSGAFDLLGPTGSDRYLYEYEVSFVAGADEEGRTIKAVLEDSSGNELKEEQIRLTTDAEKYSFTYIPTEPKKNVVLKLLVGGSENTVCVDTIRCDLKGYPESAGLDTEVHDIALLEKKAPPVISEMPADEATIKAQAIVISFDKEGNEDYKNAIESVYIDGEKVDDGYQIGEKKGKGGRNDEYTITLNSSLFDVTGDYQTFTIDVKAEWYQNNRIRQTIYKDSPWKRTWLEEFDGEELDMDKWSYQIGTGDNNDGWGNNEQQYYTDQNLKVGNGELTITAEKESKEGKPYTSSRIWTMEEDGKTAKFSQTYGRMEAKIRLAGGEGYEGVWPAFWMLPADLHYGVWPLSGEIDIIEARGREPNLAYGTVHYGKPWPNHESEGGVYDFKESDVNKDSDINDYHIYAVEWEPGEIRWYVDDEIYFTYNNWYCQSLDNPDKFRYPAPFDQDFYIILNLAVGGAFDNNLRPDNDILPVDMKVDYVRVYESKDGYKELTKEPPVLKDTSTNFDTVKSELFDSEYENINIITQDGVDLQRDAWNMVTLPGFYGSADFTTVTTDDTVYAKITPKDLGIAAHAIQLIQHLDLVKGYNYRISFDAWSEGSRKLNMKIGQDGTEGWNTYQTFETSLTSSPQHYKYEFQSGVTDLHSRVEFNLATSSQPVYIGNIKYEVIEEIIVDPDTEKEPSDNGNCVYNGSFNVGEFDGLSYWHMDNSDGKTERDGKDYVFTATKGNLYQDGLELLQNDTYKLTFSADAESERKIEVILSDKEEQKEYARETVTLTADRDTKEIEFTMPVGVTDKNARLCFVFGEDRSAIHITNIWLKRTTYNNIEWDEVQAHPLLNGDFELGSLYWSQYGNAQFEVQTDETGNHYAKVNAPQGGNKWDALLIYDKLAFTAKTDYEFSFDVKSTKDNENIRVTMEDSGYYAYFEQKELEVGTEWLTYTFDVRFTDDMDGLALKFQTGGASEAHEVYFENVIVRAKGAPKAPGIITAGKYNRLGTDIELSYDGEDDWVKNAVVYIDGVRIDADKVVFEDGKLTLDMSVFSGPKSYTLVVRSDGYTASRDIEVVIYPANGDRIVNGGFR